MKDRLAIGACLTARLRVPDVSHEKFGTARHPFPMTKSQIVKDSYFSTLSEKRFHQMTTNEARSASNQDQTPVRLLTFLFQLVAPFTG